MSPCMVTHILVHAWWRSPEAALNGEGAQMRRGQDMEWEEERVPLYRQWIFRAVVLPVVVCVLANAAATAILVKRPHMVRLWCCA